MSFFQKITISFASTSTEEATDNPTILPRL